MDCIDLLPLLLLFLFLAGMKPVQKSGIVNEHYLSIDTGNSLRGLFSIVIVFHHLSQGSKAGWLFPFFKYIGYLSTAVFFFLSGYGLQKSYIKSENYKHRFLRKRLTKVMLPYVAVTILYWIARMVNGEVYSLLDIISAILHGSPIVNCSWFIISMCYFYVAYWLFMHICKRKYDMMMLCACIWYVVYIFVCIALEYGVWWYNTSILLIAGMHWAIHEEEIIKTITKHYSIAVLITSGFFLVFFTSIYTHGTSAPLILTICTAVLFVFLVVLLILKVRIESRLFAFLGKISLDIYLIHGLLMATLRSSIIYITSDFVWSLLVLLGSILIGVIMNKITAMVFQIVNIGDNGKLSLS